MSNFVPMRYYLLYDP